MAADEHTPPPPAGSGPRHENRAAPARGRALAPKRYVGKLTLRDADDSDGSPVLDVEVRTTAGHDLEALAFTRLELEDALGEILRKRVARN